MTNTRDHGKQHRTRTNGRQWMPPALVSMFCMASTDICAPPHTHAYKMSNTVQVMIDGGGISVPGHESSTHYNRKRQRIASATAEILRVTSSLIEP